MASYGLLGALGGLGKGLAETGTMMQKDAFEKAREARLEEARVRLEQRAEEAQKRQAVWSDERTYGAEAASRISVEGTRALDIDNDVSKARAMIPVGVESAEAMIPAKVKEAEQMLPVQEQHAEKTTAATNRGHESRDARQHANALQLQREREAAANSRSNSETRTNVESNVWTNLRTDFAERYKIDADTAMAYYLQDEEEHGKAKGAPRPKFNEYMGKGAGKPNLIEFAAKEYCLDVTTGTRIPNCTRSVYKAPDEEKPKGGGLIGSSQGLSDTHKVLLKQAKEIVDEGGDAKGIRARLIEMGVPASAIPF
jgi:hypothetical protein